MKRQIVNIVGVFGLLLMAACANAQDLKLKANVPFDFKVDKATMSAGAYTINAVTSGSSALIIRNDEGMSRITLANSARSLNVSPDTRLVFHRYGDEYFLSQIWVSGEKQGREFPVSRREAEMAKNSNPAEDVIVLAELR